MIKSTFTFALIAVVVSLANSMNTDYYTGFTEALGLNAFVNDKGLDCKEVVFNALSEFKDTVEEDFNDVDLLIDSVLDIVDTLKYEVSPTCRTFHGDFKDFMNRYYGDAKALIKNTEDNLAIDHQSILVDLNSAVDAINNDEYIEAGKLHAQALRLLIGLNKTVQETGEVNKAAAEEAEKNALYQEYMNAITLMHEDVEEPNKTTDDDGESSYSISKMESDSILYSRFESLKRAAIRT